MTTVSITRTQARRFLIRRQGYRAYGSKWAGVDDVGTAIRHLGAVQIDPVIAFERNHHHALFCRIQDYRPKMLETALYERREGFEYYCNALCILPMAEYPYFRYRMRRTAESYAARHEVPQSAEMVLQRIITDGATSSRQFNSGEKVSGWWDPDNQPATKVEKYALDYLHLTGELMIAGREGVQRRYDLPEQVVPHQYLHRDVSELEWREFMMDKFLRCYGLSQTGLFRYGWFDAPKAEKKSLLSEFISSGRAFEVSIEGVKRRYYCHSALLDELLTTSPVLVSDHVVLVPPLDNLLWDRDAISDIFQFDYRWEVYVPPAKRRYGYYVLPILFGEEMVGRIELRALRDQGQLAVTGLWWENESADARSALANTVREIARYLGLDLVAM